MKKFPQNPTIIAEKWDLTNYTRSVLRITLRPVSPHDRVDNLTYLFWKFWTWSFVGPFSLWASASWLKHSFLVGTSCHCVYNTKCDGRSANCCQFSISSALEPVPVGLAASQAGVPSLAVPMASVPVFLPELPEHETTEPPSPERSHSHSLNNSSSDSSTISLKPNDAQVTAFELQLWPLLTPQSSEAMPTDNQGAFDPFQPQSSQSDFYDQSLDSTSEKWIYFPIERGIHPPSAPMKRPDNWSRLAQSSLVDTAIHVVLDRINYFETVMNNVFETYLHLRVHPWIDRMNEADWRHLL